ncbi:4Fe-4S binding protein [Methanoregula sp.]|uniref:4Fe-4S binding protein n=1 Tax=Methanoregula sp. TaxID=2052170 RepID=UPI00356A4A6B
MNRLQIRTAILFLSFLLMSVTFVYISPLVMMMGLLQGVIAAALIFWIVVFLLTFILGRAFCGYLCPMGAEQELFDKAVRTKLRRVPYLRYLKYLLAVLWVGGAIALAALAGNLAVKPLFGLGNGLPPWNAGAYLFLYGITLGVFVLVLIFGRRGMCNYFCPMSVVFMAITRIKDRVKIPSLHLEATPEDCIRCKKCEASCPMSLPVQEMAGNNAFLDPECIVCGSCADVCPKSVIRLAWFWKQ